MMNELLILPIITDLAWAGLCLYTYLNRECYPNVYFFKINFLGKRKWVYYLTLTLCLMCVVAITTDVLNIAGEIQQKDLKYIPINWITIIIIFYLTHLIRISFNKNQYETDNR